MRGSALLEIRTSWVLWTKKCICYCSPVISNNTPQHNCVPENSIFVMEGTAEAKSLWR